MSYEIVKIDKKIVAGIGIKTDNTKAINDIGKQWNTFFSECILKNKNNKNITIGLYTNYEGDYTKPYMFYTCVEVIDDNIKENSNLTTIVIPEGKYAKFQSTGNAEKTVSALWQEIWNTSLERKYTYDFEVYHDTEDEQKKLIEIFIAVK